MNETCNDFKTCKSKLEECSKQLTDTLQSGAGKDKDSAQKMYSDASGQVDQFIKWMKFYELIGRLCAYVKSHTRMIPVTNQFWPIVGPLDPHF